MASLGSLVVSLAMDTAKFSGDVGKAAQQMARLTAEAGKIGAAIGANIGAGLRTIGELVRHSIDAADETSKLAQSLGATTEEISRLAYAADLSGASQEELGQALAKLDKQAAEAAAGGRTAGDIFAAMGVQVTGTGGALKSTTELLAEVADKLASYKDGAEKTALAQEIFGRSGARLIPLLNQGAEGLAQVGAEADKLGLALTTSAGQAAEAFNDNLTRLDKAREGLGRRIAAELLPTLQMLTDRFIGSAQSAERMARQAEIAAASVKLLISSGAILVGVFQAVGQALGGAAALHRQLAADQVERLDAVGALVELGDARIAHQQWIADACTPGPRQTTVAVHDGQRISCTIYSRATFGLAREVVSVAVMEVPQ